jgi:hypothetical protein
MASRSSASGLGEPAAGSLSQRRGWPPQRDERRSVTPADSLAAGWRGRSLYSRDVNAEFNWWLLIVGLVVGAGLVWLVVADSRRREVDVSEGEREGEAQWIAEAMTDAGRRVDDGDVLDILRLHAAYLAASPPDEPFDEAVDDGVGADAPGWVAVPDHSPIGRDARERHSMAHPAGPDRPDAEGGPA